MTAVSILGRAGWSPGNLGYLDYMDTLNGRSVG